MVIEDGLAHLAAHPDHLNFILSPFFKHRAIREYVGAKHISDCVSYVVNNRIYVAPYYQADLGKVPSIVTVARQGEEQQFLGDLGDYQKNCVVLPPIKYFDFIIDGIEDDRTSLLVPEELKVEEQLWPRIWVANGSFKAQVDYIQVRPGLSTKIALKTKVPDQINYTGWSAQSGEREKGYEIHASLDSVEVNAVLTTTGDYTVHRLMSIVTRYCLKRGRLLFDHYGFQVPQISQGMPVKEEEQPPVYSTVFTIRGKLTEHWIANEFDYIDESAKLTLDYIAESEGKKDVKLE